VRKLAPDEADLWAKVAATIRPLSRDRLKPPLGPTPSAAASTKSPPRPQSLRPTAAPRPAPIPIGEKTLDGSWDKRIRSGAIEPDRILDLHGMSLDGAWAAIDRTLEQAIRYGDRVVLLITGHHRPGEPPVQRGKIRAAVHDWLAASRHAGSIAAVRGAHRRHGGGGSLYLVLRR
jgi:DNA-nicking Smr family endonuclease